MGYQESYLKPNSAQDWGKLMVHLKDNGKEFYDRWFCYPVEVITFTNDHTPFKKGDKCVYFTGERYPQSYNVNILLRSGVIAEQKYYEDKYGYEDLIKYDFDSHDFIPTEIYFTEEVDPVGIWPDAGEITDVIHEPFNFN